MLTTSEKNELSKIYAATCKAFDKVLEPDVLKMQIEDLADLGFEQILSALKIYRSDEKNLYWPRASKIRAIINPTLSLDSASNEAASRIREAISKFGWCNGGDAEKFIGGLGWDIVQKSGGWKYLCENHGINLSPLTFHAQARDLAKSLIESKNKGISSEPIQIESQNKNLIEFKPREWPK